MRRRSTAATRIIGLIVLASSPSMAQDGPLLIRPPAEVRPSPPLPSPVVPTANAGTSPGPSPVTDPMAGVVPVPRSQARPPAPDAMDLGPPSDLSPGSPEVVVRPPMSRGRPGSIDAAGPGTMVLSPTIAPALRPGEGDGIGPNPLLPTVAGREGAPRSTIVDDEVEGRARRPRTGTIPSERDRPGLLGGLLGRLSGRPPGASTPPATSAPDPDFDPNDPAAIEALRRGLERQIMGREGGRLASLEVLIVGRRVHIRAQAARLWQRRALRRALEDLPMPAGFLSTVEVR